MDTLELVHCQVESLLRELRTCVQMPEAFIEEHFAAVRSDIDAEAEAWLQSLDPGDEDAVALNSQRQSMMDELDRHCKKCLEHLEQNEVPQNSFPAYRAALEELGKAADLEESLLIERYADLKELIEEETLDVSFELLLRKRFVFIENRRGRGNFGQLLILNNINLTDAEVKWLQRGSSRRLFRESDSSYIQMNRPFFNRIPHQALDFQIIKEVNEIEKLEDKSLFKTKLPKNLFILASILSIRKASKTTAIVDKPSVKRSQFVLILDWQHIYVQVVPGRFFAECRNLYSVQMRSLGIERIGPDAFCGLLNLINIDLSGNKIKAISADMLKDLANLFALDLRDNQIGFIHSDAFRNTKKLNKIDLSHNRIKEIDQELFSNLASLTHLNLSNNEIHTIEEGAFRRCQGLLELFLNNNKLSEVNLASFGQIPWLVNLDLSFNCISTIHNTIAELKLNDSSIKRLRLHQNHLTVLDNDTFRRFPRLRFLTLDHNKIGQIHKAAFVGLFVLKRLTLNHNHINKLHESTFCTLKRLKFLSLEHNHLKELPEDLFSHNQTLEVVNLEANSLSKIRSRKKVFIRNIFVDPRVRIENYCVENTSESPWWMNLLLFLLAVVLIILLVFFFENASIGH